jgi:hypothetical protein
MMARNLAIPAQKGNGDNWNPGVNHSLIFGLPHPARCGVLHVPAGRLGV